MNDPLYPDPHAELVERCKTGERGAQYQLYRLYSKAMYNVCLRMLNRAEEAEDILQDAFLDAFTHLHRFRQQSTFGAWLKQIVVNKAISQLRARRIKWVELESLQNAEKEYDIEDHYYYETDNEELKIESIKKAVRQLPDGYRVVLSLYLFEGYDHEEISALLGVSESTSRTQYMRAKQKLLDIVKKKTN